MRSLKSANRRDAILHCLRGADGPVPGGELARVCQVSRQVIVQDISLLRAEGYDILSTHNGYVLLQPALCQRVLKVRHTSGQTEDELTCVVDLGGTVVDVFVHHKVYGTITAKLNIGSRSQIKQFLEGVRSGRSTELMTVTGGYHYHTVCGPNEAVLNAIEAALRERGYLAET